MNPHNGRRKMTKGRYEYSLNYIKEDVQNLEVFSNIELSKRNNETIMKTQGRLGR